MRKSAVIDRIVIVVCTLAVIACFAAMLLLAGCAPDEEPIPQETPEENLDDPELGSSSSALTSEDGTPSPVAGTARVAFRYDRSLASRWIGRYASEPNPKFAYCGDWTFSEGKLRKTAADCTNFASQVLWAGGLPLESTGSEHSGWWYGSGCDAKGSSKSWRQVNSLLYWLVVERSYGEFRGQARDLEVGDLIFYRLRREEDGWRCGLNAVYNHTAVVSGHDGRGEPLVSYHSNDAHDVPWAAKNGSRGALGEACSVALVHIK